MNQTQTDIPIPSTRKPLQVIFKWVALIIGGIETAYFMSLGEPPVAALIDGAVSGLIWGCIVIGIVALYRKVVAK